MLLSCHIRYFTVPNLCHLAPLWAYYKHFSIFRLQLFYYNYNIIWRFIVNLQLELKQIVDFPRAGFTGNLYKPLWKTEASVPTEVPVFFIFSFYVLMQITAPLIGTSNTLLTKLFLANGSVLLRTPDSLPPKIPAPGHILLDTLVEQNPFNLLTARKK